MTGTVHGARLPPWGQVCSRMGEEVHVNRKVRIGLKATRVRESGKL